jgi:hypothetical protein
MYKKNALVVPLGHDPHKISTRNSTNVFNALQTAKYGDEFILILNG